MKAFSGLTQKARTRLAASALVLLLLSVSYRQLLFPGTDYHWWTYLALASLWGFHLLVEITLLSDHSMKVDFTDHGLLANTLNQSLPVGYSAVNAHGVLTELGGDTYYRSCSRESPIGKSVLSVTRHLPGIHEDIQKALAGEDFVSEREVEGRRYKNYYFPIVTVYGDFQGYKCITLNLSQDERQQAELLLAQQVLDNINDGIVVCDAHRNVLSVNHGFEKITGFREEEMVGTRFGIPGVGKEEFSFYRNIISSLHNQRRWYGEVWAKKHSGDLFFAQVSLHAIYNKDQLTNYVVFFTDLTEIKRTQEELHYLANHDPLTGLPNRRLFLDRLDQAIRRSKRLSTRLAVYFIDLDNFKIINDSLGHQHGDELLKSVADRLKESLREVDTVARLAGDEFTVIAENITDNIEIIAVAQKILGCFDSPFGADFKQLNTSASVGISIYPESGESVESLMQQADRAMYKAKSQGRNGYFYLNDTASGRFSTQAPHSSELEMAIHANQLELVYQPEIDLKSGQLVGCEALLRWNHLTRGQLMPNEFLSISDEPRLLSAIGNWVARQGCYQFKEWREQGLNFDFLAINIAAAQLDDPDFLQNIQQALAANGMFASALNIEIPEPIAIADIAKTRLFIRKANDIGLTCVIDDFGGTGEGFHYMRELPVKMVKLDQKLLLAINSGRDSQALLKAVVSLAEVLSLKIVGVGVERLLQGETLEELGCHYGQGYLYAKPMSASAFTSFFQTHHRFANGEWKAGQG